MSRCFRTVVGWHRPLAWFAMAMVCLGLVSLIGYFLDPRILVGVPIWAKPLKFSISFVAYAVTLAWMLNQVRRRRLRTVGWWAGTALAVVSVLEMSAITLQVVRGTRSHFNVSTPFDTIVYAAMGLLVLGIYLCTLVIAVVLIASPGTDPAARWAVRLGLPIAVAGLSVGFLMAAPTAAQTARGSNSALLGAHSVDVADGGPALPFVGWSTTGGDLRVAHFIGMHGLQALPLLVILLGVIPRTSRPDDRTRVRIVMVAAAAYGGVMVLTLWQALRGQPLTSPDALTWLGLGILVLAIGIATGLLSRASRTHDHTPQGPIRTRHPARHSARNNDEPGW